MPKIAILGGGLSGLTAAWQLHRLGLPFTLYEASPRLGGIVQTVHRDGFTIELGPDSWITEKPSAAELAHDLGLADDLLPSNDSTRRTYILHRGTLLPIPDGMRLMVPSTPAALAALEHSPLFTPSAIAAYRSEPHRAADLKSAAPLADESIASFVRRHFGEDVLQTLAAPLLSGVLGGDVHHLSVQAVMPAFVQMERTHGSLILALQSQTHSQTPSQIQTRAAPPPSIFTTLRSGLQTLIDRMAADLPPDSVHLNSPVETILPDTHGWRLQLPNASPSPSARPEPRPEPGPEPRPTRSRLPRPDLPNQTSHFQLFDHLILATPAHVTRRLLSPLDPAAASLLDLSSSSAVLAAFAFSSDLALPPGFGFLVPPRTPGHALLACTFVDQKFPGRAPAGHRLLRAFFGDPLAPTLHSRPYAEIADLALAELRQILGPLPHPAFSRISRWPQSLPQYAVGHLSRIAQLKSLLPPNLHLLGNSYAGVGLPDLIREARAFAHHLAAQP